MNALNEVYYDEHIKSHQRHILVSWLESARSERIRAVKDKVKVHSVKVPVPHDVIEPIYLPEHGEDEKEAMRRRFEGISTGVEVPEAVALPEQSEDEKAAILRRFEGIATGVELPEAVVLPEQTEDEKAALRRRFEGIATGVELPEAVALPEQTEDEKAALRRRFEGISTGVELPEAVNVGREIVSAVLPEIKMPSAGTADISDILECLKADRSRIVRNEAQ